MIDVALSSESIRSGGARGSGDRRCAAWRAWRVSMVAVLLAVAAPGHAQPAEETPSQMPASDGARPWAAGVSAEKQARALELYVAGNIEFKELRYAQALAKYREAIQHWDHPAIRFNIAVCLINLDQLLEAKENLDRSLTYGAGPLGAESLAQGLTYRKLLDAQLAHVSIRCEQPGTEVTLDGKLLFTGPGAADEFLLPGYHQVVASKDGFLTSSKTLVLAAGQPLVHDIRHLELKVTIRMARRWDFWKPWAVLSGGAALVNIGVLTYVVATNHLSRYEDGVASRCAGCSALMLAAPEFEGLRDQKSRGDTEHTIAVALLATGGAAIAAGVLGLILNQPTLRVEPLRGQTAVTPVRGGAAVSMSWRF